MTIETEETRDPFNLQIRQAKVETKILEDARNESSFKESFRAVIASRDGRVVLARLLEDSGLFTPAFDTNALNMARKEGKREFASKVFDYIMRYAPETYSELRGKDE